MIMQAEANKIYTPEEYLEREVESAIRHEYRSGEIIPMTGGTPNHNDIAGNLYILLKSSLKGKAYRTFYADQRLWIPGANLYTYPDVMVLSKPLELQAGRQDTVINPCLIAEVLSRSTQNYDRSEKFVAYRTISTFQEYLLIDQYRIYVEHYVKTADHQWLFSEHDDPKITLTLNTINLQIQISNLYENIDFPNE
ncbi:Uma2 family endonuclease [Phormidium sp. FACHB-1136]|jgi:Uma2 family endonuclease|uniref:Uma2 family endonuclease n=1 Tax=Phormidium sp. FACHB-1136 TaxID=2692848 RepID=UPI00168221C0|nr:Uma2 family endonuclease [Phormidium sp. FACHB-1136]MBD2428981.1 Uma2 family endonuclease [Phormidium sp. FACHB-1136]